MKPIRIIKRAQVREATAAAADESKKPVEPTTRTLADTVKSWIAETEQRKRTQRHSLAALGFLVLMAFTVGMGQSTQQASTQTPPLKVTIATTAGFLGQPNSRFKVGEQIPVSITMTNMSAQQLYTCVSSDLYQDRPKLTRDGEVVPYLNAASYETRYARRNRVCKQENIPEQVLLEPHKPTGLIGWCLSATESLLRLTRGTTRCHRVSMSYLFNVSWLVVMVHWWSRTR